MATTSLATRSGPACSPRHAGVLFTRAARITETDVVFNRARNWNSIEATARSASGGTLIDLRRVALHEFGHAIGPGSSRRRGAIGPCGDEQSHQQRGQPPGRRHQRRRRDLRWRRGATVPPPATRSNRAPTVTAGCNPCTIEIGGTARLSPRPAIPMATCSATSGPPRRSVLERRVRRSCVDARARAGSGRRNHFRIGWPGRERVHFADAAGRAAGQAARGRPPPVSGQSLISTDGRYRLVYQGDGNLVLYDDVDRSAPWSSGTAGWTTGQVVMQTDGNFVIYMTVEPAALDDAVPEREHEAGAAGRRKPRRLHPRRDGRRGIASAIPPAWSRTRGCEVPEVVEADLQVPCTRRGGPSGPPIL